MSFYEPQGWQAPVRQGSWEQPAPPSRSGNSSFRQQENETKKYGGASSTSQREESNAFAMQFEEVERAIDNLVKSGKMFGGPRRDMGPSHGSHGSRGHGHGGRHSVGDFRPPHRSAANMQNFYAQQRYQGRPSEADQIMQAKRRMAAQRERELRNYHQEQQYNRSVLAEMASNKSDRSMSPSTLSEEGRRELLARQHRALYGPEGASFGPQGHYNQGSSGPEQSGQSSSAGPQGMRGNSPRGMDPFGMSQQDDGSQQPSNEGKNNSPSSHQQGKAASPSAGDDSAHARTISKSTTAPMMGSIGPIGSRPNPQYGPGQSLNKRTTSPLPSAGGYGSFGTNESGADRQTSSSGNAGQKENNTPSMGTWGTGSGVWGNKLGGSMWS